MDFARFLAVILLCAVNATVATAAGPSSDKAIADIEHYFFCEGELRPGCIDFTKQNYKKAYSFFARLAERGDAAAMNNMGVMHEAGLGTSTDVYRARQLYAFAAEAGVAIAQFNLGMLLASKLVLGKKSGTDMSSAEREQELIDAYMWLRVAARQGLSHAMVGSDELAKFMTKKQIELSLNRAQTVLQRHRYDQ